MHEQCTYDKVHVHWEAGKVKLQSLVGMALNQGWTASVFPPLCCSRHLSAALGISWPLQEGLARLIRRPAYGRCRGMEHDSGRDPPPQHPWPLLLHKAPHGIQHRARLESS